MYLTENEKLKKVKYELKSATVLHEQKKILHPTLVIIYINKKTKSVQWDEKQDVNIEKD